jgi:PAS domain S-box-containing protein
MSGAVRDSGSRQRLIGAGRKFDQRDPLDPAAVAEFRDKSGTNDPRAKRAAPLRSNLIDFLPRRPQNSSLPLAVRLPSQHPPPAAKRKSPVTKSTRKPLADHALRWGAVFNHPAIGIVATDPEGRFLETNRSFQRMTGYTERELRRLSVQDLSVDQDRETSRHQITRLLKSKSGPVEIEELYRRKDGAVLWTRAAVSLIRPGAGRPQYLVKVIEETGERRPTEKYSLRQLRALMGRLETEREEDRKRLARVVHDDVGQALTWIKMDLLRLLSGARPGADTRAANAESLLKILDQTLDMVFTLAAEIRPGQLAQLAQTLTIMRTDLRVLLLSSAGRRGDQTAEANSLLRLLDGTAAAMYGLAERVRRGVLADFARSLRSIRMGVVSLFLTPAGGSEEGQAKVDSLFRLLDETSAAMQTMASDLRPGVLDDLGLVAAIEWAVGEFQTRSKIRCSLSLPRTSLAAHPERDTAVFRILQESLANIARHAGASRVEINLTESKELLRLQVHDNGRGISKAQLSDPHSLRILGMRERAAIVGGRLIVRSTPRKGTTVSVSIPGRTDNAQPEVL